MKSCSSKHCFEKLGPTVTPQPRVGLNRWVRSNDARTLMGLADILTLSSSVQLCSNINCPLQCVPCPLNESVVRNNTVMLLSGNEPLFLIPAWIHPCFRVSYSVYTRCLYLWHHEPCDNLILIYIKYPMSQSKNSF